MAVSPGLEVKVAALLLLLTLTALSGLLPLCAARRAAVSGTAGSPGTGARGEGLIHPPPPHKERD